MKFLCLELQVFAKILCRRVDLLITLDSWRFIEQYLCKVFAKKKILKTWLEDFSFAPRCVSSGAPSAAVEGNVRR